MANVTLSMEDSLIRKGRKHAQKKGKTLNGLIRELLSKEIEEKNTEWLDRCFSLMDTVNIKSKREKWKRDELHER